MHELPSVTHVSRYRIELHRSLQGTSWSQSMLPVLPETEMQAPRIATKSTRRDASGNLCFLSPWTRSISTADRIYPRTPRASVCVEDTIKGMVDQSGSAGWPKRDAQGGRMSQRTREGSTERAAEQEEDEANVKKEKSMHESRCNLIRGQVLLLPLRNDGAEVGSPRAHLTWMRWQALSHMFSCTRVSCPLWSHI